MHRHADRLRELADEFEAAELSVSSVERLLRELRGLADRMAEPVRLRAVKGGRR